MPGFKIPSNFNPTTGINIERIFDADSDASPQEPTGKGTALSLKIKFGPAKGTVFDPLMIDVDGKTTVNKSGLYRFKVALQYGRTGASGISLLLFGVMIQGVQAGKTVISKLNNPNEDKFFENDTWIFLSAGTELTFELMRDEVGDNSGGLFGFSPTAEGGNEWNVAPSASLRAERWVGN